MWRQILPPVIRAEAGSQASTRQSDQIAGLDEVESKLFLEDRTCIRWLFVKHCEQADHHPEVQPHWDKVEAKEVFTCTHLVTDWLFMNAKVSKIYYPKLRTCSSTLYTGAHGPINWQ